METRIYSDMDRETIAVLHVDGDRGVREDVAEQIGEHSDMSVTGTRTIERATDRLADDPVDCVISEYDLSDGTAFDLFSRVREQYPDAACILYTDAAFAEIDNERSEEMVVEYLSKRIPGTEQRLPGLVRDITLGRMQVGYPVPENEDERLDTVTEYDLDKFASSPAFERLATLARSHFGVNAVFIGIMKAHEEELLACRGAEWSVFDRQNTICTYSMLEDGPTVIEDVQADSRFEHNERLEELGIRSWAGVNLTTPEGTVLGELCLIHDTPRTYDEADLEDLRLFAEEVVEQLELRRRIPPSETTPELGE